MAEDAELKALQGFVAYPSTPEIIGSTIDSAVGEARAHDFLTWRETDIVGRFLAHQILGQIDSRDFLVADITELNFNVTYEIGYAIARGRPLLLIRNASLAEGSPTLAELGLFDTMGYKTYENSSDLTEILQRAHELQAIHIPRTELNRTAPVYLIEAQYKTDAVTRIIARVKKARLFYRSFDPNEQPRLSAFDGIQQVAQSYGVLLHLLPTRVKDVRIHNLRVAFLAGLATGMGKALLLLQEGDEPVPLDYRDLVTPFYSLSQIDDAIAEFAARVTEAFQEPLPQATVPPRSFLETLNLGASSAENELRDLRNYYIEVDAFRRAMRGEVRIAVGRKGSGKTALFLQVRDRVRQHGKHIVLDLKPEGYKLLKFRADVLGLLQTGTVDHTLTALWEYLLLLEICRKLLESDQKRHLRDDRLYEPYRTLERIYSSDEYVAEGDFSERMSTLLQRIREDFQAQFSSTPVSILSQAQITELLYKHDISALRTHVTTYLQNKESLWLLIDNLDKGWPTHGIRAEDLIILRSLLDATRKLEQDLSRYRVEAHTLVFLRNDVFELLIEETSDRGKELKVGLDWTDPDLLRELVRRRLVFNGLPDEPFEQVWRRVCSGFIAGEETSQYLIDRSLMRPRALLDLIGHCRGCAVNLGHSRIEADDIKKGVALYSTDLVRDISLEIRDVLPEGEDALYAFIDADATLTEGDLRQLLRQIRLTPDQEERVVDILLWFGVLGLKRGHETEYIYSLNYDMRLLKGRIRSAGDAAIFSINPAFWPGLGIQGT